MTPRALIKITLVILPMLGLMAVAVLILSARTASLPQPMPIPTPLAANSETRVDLTPGSAARLYSITAASATRLQLDSRTPGFAFAAEIRSAAGQTVARFNNGLQDVQLTLAPDVGLYQIAVSAADPRQAGTLSLALGSAVIAPETLDGTAFHAVNCRVTNAVGTNALIRSAPADQYALLGLLPANASLPAIGRTDNDWYTVDFAERQGWMRGDVVALSGDCGALPVVRNPTIPNAPADAQAFLIQVDRDGSGTFREAISAPDGDTQDVIWVRIINLDSQPPNNYRSFALTLDCTGVGVEAVRWGDAHAPTLACGATVVLPFLNGNAQTPIAVLFPSGSHQSYVEYTLSVQPMTAVG